MNQDVSLLYNKVKERIEFHDKKAKRQANNYKKLSKISAYAIPLGTLLLNVFISLKLNNTMLIISGFLVTSISTVYSVMNPSKRFTEAATRGIELHDIELKLEVNLKQLDGNEAIKFLLDIDKEISNIGMKMIPNAVFVPENSSGKSIGGASGGSME